MRRERYVARMLVRPEVGDVALVQLLQSVVVETVFADVVQQADEVRVALAVDVRQLDAEIITFRQGLAVEKESGRIVLFQQIPLIVFGDRR